MENMNEMPMSDREKVASHYRSIELNNLADWEKEILKNAKLKVEEGQQRHDSEGRTSHTLIISGEVDGHNIKVIRETAFSRDPSWKLWRMEEVDNKRVYVPESSTGPANSVYDKCSGEMDGDPLSEAEAEELWNRYHRVAAALNEDQALADFSKES